MDDLSDLLMHEVWESTELLKSSGMRLVHYTSAQAAFSILDGEELWMRSVRCMNDYSEVEHGLELLGRTFGRHRDRIKAACDRWSSDLFQTLTNGFDATRDAIRYDTYVACVSEHYDNEDELGRLSMWRAYGGSSAKVGIVVDPLPMNLPIGTLGLMMLKVNYWTDQQFDARFLAGLQRFENVRPEARIDLMRELVVPIVNWFRVLVLTSKHVGFREEAEWRVIYSPMFQSSDHIPHEDVVISGVPQRVYKVPLHDVPGTDWIGLTVGRLVRRVIIGPTDYGMAQYKVFKALMASKEGGDHSEVVVSNIPLRQ